MTDARIGIPPKHPEPGDPKTSHGPQHHPRQQELLAELGAYALRTTDLDALLQEAARLVALDLQTSFSKIVEYLPSEDHFLVRTGVGWREGIVSHYRTGADLAAPAGYAFRTGKAVISSHLAAEGRFRTPKILIEHSIQRAINVAIHNDDVGLPGGMNGRQMADAARVGRPDLKVLFITGYVENAVVGNGHLEPGMTIMMKPFAMEALAGRIKEMISGHW